MTPEMEILHVTDVAPEIVSEAAMFGAWPGMIRDALREAGSKGLSRDAVVDLLGSRTESGWVKHPTEIDNALDYLVAVGLAKRQGNRWMDIPAHPPRGNLA